jgi:NAD(P)-dependent dehydrogenase (short-subunit alcohol dehydrogenase family)
MFDLEGKYAIVTGAGSGIGKEIASVFARHGAHVAVLDIDADAANETAQAIASSGGAATAHTCDVGDQGAVDIVFDTERTQRGRIDIVVNNAGVSAIGKVEDTSEADFDRVFRTNVKGVYNGLKAAVRVMKSTGGVILNMASVASSVGIPERFAYSMSKGAVRTMTYSVAVDYLDAGIRCNSISPARVHTPFVDAYLAATYPGREQEMFDALSRTQPIGRMGGPEEVAALALYLCSDEAAFVTGTDFPIDGGFISLKT